MRQSFKAPIKDPDRRRRRQIEENQLQVRKLSVQKVSTCCSGYSGTFVLFKSLICFITMILLRIEDTVLVLEVSVGKLMEQIQTIILLGIEK